MSPVIAHAGQDLPLSLDVATAVLVVGLFVFGIVVYDLYSRHWRPAGGGPWR